MMPKNRLTPQEKKQISYERDHYNRGGQSLPSWWRLKPGKKKFIHSLRRRRRMQFLKFSSEHEPEITAQRKYTTLRISKVEDWGAIRLREFVDTRRARSQRRRNEQD